MVNDEDYIIKMPPGEEDVHPDGVGWFLYEMMIRHKNKIAQVSKYKNRILFFLFVFFLIVIENL